MAFIPLRTTHTAGRSPLTSFNPGLSYRTPATEAAAQAILGPAPEPTPEPKGPDPAVLAALEQAYQEGRKTGQEEMRAEMLRLQSDFQVLGPLVEQLRSARVNAIRSSDSAVAQLVIALARRIAGDTLILTPEALASVVTRSLERLPESDEVWVRVPPSAEERIREALGPKTAAQIVGDPQVKAGCIVETRQTAIDSTIDAAMEGVETAIRNWLETRP